MSEGRYRTIVADPPWPYAGRGPVGAAGRGRAYALTVDRPSAGSVEQYGSLTVPEICSLNPPAASDAHLYLWTTNAFVVEAHTVAGAWGFSPKTILTWVKTHAEDPARPAGKAGYYFRGATEHCLFCVRGSLPLLTDEVLPTAYLWPRYGHSIKPDAFYDLVERCSPEPRLEMFSRRARLSGWEYHGDQSLGTAQLMAPGVSEGVAASKGATGRGPR